MANHPAPWSHTDLDGSLPRDSNGVTIRADAIVAAHNALAAELEQVKRTNTDLISLSAVQAQRCNTMASELETAKTQLKVYENKEGGRK